MRYFTALFDRGGACRSITPSPLGSLVFKSRSQFFKVKETDGVCPVGPVFTVGYMITSKIANLIRWSHILCNSTSTLCPCESGVRLHTYSGVYSCQGSGCQFLASLQPRFGFTPSLVCLPLGSRGFSNGPAFVRSTAN